MKHKFWTHEEERQLVEDYPNLQLSQSDLENKYGRNFPAIKMRAIKLGLSRGKNYPSSTKKYKLPLTKQEICALYLSGLTTREIAEKCNCSAVNIQYLLKREGVYLRDSKETSRIYKLNEKCFDCWNDQSAYFLGLLMADGYNHQQRGVIDITLKSVDKDIIIKFQKFVGTNKPIQNIVCKSQSRLSICSEYISKKLANMGMIQNKTHYCDFPLIPNEFMSSFMRGYFDGDGGVTSSKTIHSNVGFNITGNRRLVEKYQEILINSCGLTLTKLDTRKKNIPNIVTLRYSGKNNLRIIHDFLYHNATVWMDRKYKQFSELIM